MDIDVGRFSVQLFTTALLEPASSNLLTDAPVGGYGGAGAKLFCRVR